MSQTEIGARQVVSGVLGAILVLGVLGLVYYAVTPVPATPAATAFYVVNESGTAANYQTDLSVGEETTVVVGIENDEHRETTYEFAAVADGTRLDNRSVTLDDGETWERPLTLSFRDPGARTVELRLYRDRPLDGDPYRELQLAFEVEE
ncbi:DUF1616 domain-containing protein [Halosimplex salinum]|uniref:DUF1616 domain-containing protein n=1 Tax=Halosimplex salinum TaxID=1710538 RepID=UPI000F48CC97